MNRIVDIPSSISGLVLCLVVVVIVAVAVVFEGCCPLLLKEATLSFIATV